MAFQLSSTLNIRRTSKVTGTPACIEYIAEWLLARDHLSAEELDALRW
jgi:hypothetical protein